MLAAGTPAEAGVIYVNPPDQTYINAGFQLDLNSDGAPDVTFTAPSGGFYGYFWRSLRVNAHGVNVGPLLPGAAIGPSTPFSTGNPVMAWLSWSTWGFYAYWGGPWANVRDGYLGLRFLIGPNTHYGWVRMDVSVDTNLMTISATVKDWAYDNTAGADIVAGDTGVVPEPGTLSLLALGSAGLALWRKRKAKSRVA